MTEQGRFSIPWVPGIFALTRLVLCLVLMTAVPRSAVAEQLGLLELMNYVEYSDRLASSGQPTPEQLPVIAEAGVKAVISLVPLGEPGTYADEGARIEALGLAYVHIPVNWEQPPLADLEAFFAAMARFDGQPVLVHCYANARASAFVYLWRTLKAGQDEAAARQTMVSVWDLNEGYEFANVPHWVAFVDSAIATYSAAAE